MPEKQAIKAPAVEAAPISGSDPDLSVTVLMPSSRNGRRFALVSNVLSQMGIHHNAVFPVFRRLKLKGLERAAANSRFCHLRWKVPKKSNVLITDLNKENRHGKTIRISYDFKSHLFGKRRDDTLFLPILFHPNLLDHKSYEQAEELSQYRDRDIGVLFAGNCDQKTYDNDRISEQFGLANRHELYQAALKLPSDMTYFPKTREEFEDALAKGQLKNKFVWIDTELFRVPQNKWLALVASARYFFCTPGVHYPYCQNLNEAMACGTVPVLQYPQYYLPPLADGENCMVFDTSKAIEATLRQVLDPERESQWLTRSAAAKAWHEAHLSLNVACLRLAEFLEDPKREEMTWILAGK